MTSPPNGERRPWQDGARTPAKNPDPVLAGGGQRPLAASEAGATEAARRRCGHPLSAPKSVARELGPVCLHLVRGEVR